MKNNRFSDIIEIVLKGGNNMNCLNCGSGLTTYIVKIKDNQVTYHICEKCGSLWLPEGELNKMAYQVDGDIEFCSEDKVKNDQAPEINCPKCKYAKLDRVHFIENDEITLGKCHNCGGFWLNAGQLDLINKKLSDIMPIKGKGFSEFLNNVHLPLWYKRIRLQCSQRGEDTDLLPLKGSELKSKTEHYCPACGEFLNSYNYHGFEIEGCPSCKGLWLDKNELRDLKDKIDAHSWKTLRWLDDEIENLEKANAIISNRDCPICKKEKLLATTFGDSPIVIDWCPKCHGTWLDKHEFEDIVDYLKKELNEMDPDEAKKIVYKKLKDIWTGPEGPIDEILDSTAAIAALINITVFQHPKLAKLLIQFNKLARGIGV